MNETLTMMIELLIRTVTCMDNTNELPILKPRINMDLILKQLSLTSANSYIVRNAGGRAKEALRSVIVSQEFLGTSEVHVVHHTDCGMANQSEGSMRKRFYKSDDKSRTVMVNDMEFLPIRTTVRVSDPEIET
ncbi:hypothetical protein BN14_09179 [Rhizoctonia solani AG-1 IB]|uniref:Carbonic anhydrase n=1 Tax=Thanatephorus cucumeris (strain AG1-IB / isolate 7/3/14) TaxID=1108050 RepID=M5C7N4_THACB|nr:hypothetical protein BN14_09179 [Rhizoctonia solani AG-1 IB]